MMNNSFFASNSEKINFDSSMIFDRVINLKFTTEVPDGNGHYVAGDSYVIRSDYEIVYDNFNTKRVLSDNGIVNKNYYFRKCRHKPSIKVQYKQVSGGTNTEIDIFISNFFLMDKDGNCMQTFDIANNRLAQVEMMLGYFGQFKKTFDPLNDTLEKYLTLEPTVDIDKIVMRGVEYATFDKLPPDSVLHIHGYVGNIDRASVDDANEVTSFSDLEAEDYTFVLGNKSIDEVFETLITRRFLKNSVLDSASKDKEVAKSIVFTDKLLSKEDAKKFGIKVRFDRRVKNLKIEPKLDSEDQAQVNEITIKRGDTSLKAMNIICQSLDSRLKFRLTNDGNYFVYIDDDSTDVEMLNEDLQGTFNNAYSKRNGILPAVININVNAVSSISCPFYGFLEPFQDFFFSTRYSLTSLVTYYASIDIKTYKFFAIAVSVSFATVEDVNEMNIRATVKK